MVLASADIILSGADGKMGHALAVLSPRFFCGQVFDAKNVDFSRIPGPVLWIDFSHALAFDSILTKVKLLQCPLVMGTTGLSSAQQHALKRLGRTLPVFYDTNFSLGITLLRHLIRSLPQGLAFDVGLFESHHRSKMDKPSGTAKTLQADLKRRLGEVPIEILSYRGGGIFGEHQIILAGLHEKITLIHEALDRTVFAEGALQAAQWLLTRRPGFYHMEDFYRDRFS